MLKKQEVIPFPSFLTSIANSGLPFSLQRTTNHTSWSFNESQHISNIDLEQTDLIAQTSTVSITSSGLDVFVNPSTGEGVE